MQAAAYPRVFPGRLHASNKGAIDWGPQGLVAYGCNNYVVVVDPGSLKLNSYDDLQQVIQTLDEHRHPVVLVKWSPENLFSDPSDPQGSYRLTVASADQGGVILVWDVWEGVVSGVLSAGSATATSTAAAQPPEKAEPSAKTYLLVADMKWLPATEGHSMLLALYHSSFLILWNTKTASKVWRYDILDSISSFGLDPFDSQQIIVCTESYMVYLLKGHTTETGPTAIKNKFKIATPSPSSSAPSSVSAPLRTSGSLSSTAAAVLSNSIGGPPPPQSLPPLKLPALRAYFSPVHRNIIYFLLERDIVVFDLSLLQSVSVLSQPVRSPFASMILCRDQLNFMYTLHEDGSICVHEKSTDDFSYTTRSVTELARFSKQTKRKGAIIYSLTNGNLHEDQLVSVTNDGIVWLWECATAATSPSRDLVITGMLQNLAFGLSSMAIPPWHERESTSIAMLLGTFAGTIQLLNRNGMEYEHLVRPQVPIRGVRFVSNNELLYYTSEEKDNNLFRNNITLLNYRSGRVVELRKPTTAERTFIRGMRLSQSARYLLVLLRDKGPELWNLESRTLIRTLDQFPDITALEWQIHINFRPDSVREELVYSLTDGILRFLAVENNEVGISKTYPELPCPFVTSVAWRDNVIVAGDQNGVITVHSTETRKSQSFNTGRGMIRKIRFSPAEKTRLILVLFADGEFGVWDLDNSVRLIVSPFLRARGLKALDCEWLAELTPVLVTSDGCLRVLDRSLSVSNSPIQPSSILKPLSSPFLLQTQDALRLRLLMRYADESTLFDDEHWKLLAYISPATVTTLANGRIIDRCVHIADFYGSEEERKFWLLARDALQRGVIRKAGTNTSSSLQNSLRALHYNASSPHLTVTTAAKANPLSNSARERSSSQSGTKDTGSTGSSITSTSAVTAPPVSPHNSGPIARMPLGLNNPRRSFSLDDPCDSTLPPYFDILSHPVRLKAMEQRRATQLEQKQIGSFEMTKKYIDLQVSLGNYEKAIEHLLAIPSSNPNYQFEALRACVIAASVSPSWFRDTTKLAATNFIANGNLDDGVQLLCLAGKHVEACRYLQTYDRWIDAAWLAKLNLSEADAANVLRKWADHLVATEKKSRAIHLLLSLGDVIRVLELLLDLKQPVRAMFLFEAIVQYSVLQPADLETKLRDRLYEDFITTTQLLDLHRLARLEKRIFAHFLKLPQRYYTSALKAMQAGQPPPIPARSSVSGK